MSAYVTFQAFARPLIRRLMGAATEPRTVRAIAGGTMFPTKGQLHLLRGSVRTEGSIRHVDQVTMPHALGELAASNALIVLDEHVELVRAAEQVPVWILDEDWRTPSSSRAIGAKRCGACRGVLGLLGRKSHRCCLR